MELQPGQAELTALEHCRRGRAEAFEVIVKRYMTWAYGTALGLVGNSADAEDLSQEAFIKAYTHLDTLQADRKFIPWFYQILRNLCLSHLRRRKCRPAVQAEDFIFTEHEDPAEDRPGSDMERKELMHSVWRAIDKLSPNHREIIILRHFQHLSYEHIAQCLHCSKGSVMSRLYHARRRLAEQLDHVNQRRSCV